MTWSYTDEIVTACGDSNTAAANAYFRQLAVLAAARLGIGIVYAGPNESINDPISVGGHSYTFDYDANGGWRINNLKNGEGAHPGIVAVMGTYTPDVLLIQIGHNDVDFGSGVAIAPIDVTAFRLRYIALLDLVLATNPDIRIFVSTIPPCLDATLNANTILGNAEIWSLRASYPTVTFIDGYAAFTDVDDWETVLFGGTDGLHFNAAGHLVLAEAFYPELFPAPSEPGEPEDIFRSDERGP